MQPVLLLRTRAELTPLGLQRTSMGESKLLLYLIPRNNTLCCISLLLPVPCPFPCLTLPRHFSHLYLILIKTFVCFPHFPSIFSCFLACFFIFSPFTLFLPFLVLFSLALLQSAWAGFTALNLGHLQWPPELVTWFLFIVKKTRTSTFGAQWICADLDTSECNAGIHDSPSPSFGSFFPFMLLISYSPSLWLFSFASKKVKEIFRYSVMS